MSREIFITIASIVGILVYIDITKAHVVGANARELVVIDNSSYFIGETSLIISATEAGALCNDQGMTMVSFETEEKWISITNWMDKNGYSGLNHWSSGRKVNSTAWEWSSNEVLIDYDQWAVDQPDETRDNDICVSFMSNYGWADAPCVNAYRLMCQLD